MAAVSFIGGGNREKTTDLSQITDMSLRIRLDMNKFIGDRH
jgi:hypothetical protein